MNKINTCTSTFISIKYKQKTSTLKNRCARVDVNQSAWHVFINLDENKNKIKRNFYQMVGMTVRNANRTLSHRFHRHHATIMLQLMHVRMMRTFRTDSYNVVSCVLAAEKYVNNVYQTQYTREFNLKGYWTWTFENSSLFCWNMWRLPCWFHHHTFQSAFEEQTRTEKNDICNIFCRDWDIWLRLMIATVAHNNAFRKKI